MDFISDKPVIKFKDYLVISDVHIGFEEYLENKGYTIPDQTSVAINRLKELSKISKKLIILGDVKHSVKLSNRSKLLLLLSKLSDFFSKVIIIKGNHDGGIENYTIRYENIQVVSELLIDSTLFLHGHKYASEENMKKAKTLFIGHFHSAHKLKDFLGQVITKKTWILYEFDNNFYLKNRKTKTSIKRVIGFPCFNNFFDGTGEKNGPYSKYLKRTGVLTLDLIRLE